jgi:deoxycytidylate deaminase
MSGEPRISLVFALVAATGLPLRDFIEQLSGLLVRYGFEPVQIRLTDLLQQHVLESGSVTWSNEAERIERLMDAGDAFRAQLKRRDAMALLATLGIQDERRRRDPTKSYAYIVRQLKVPDEVSTLRQIYGDRLFVISAYSTFAERLDNLIENAKIEKTIAKRLIDRDEEDEYKTWGQRTRDAFELGDVFFRPSDAIKADVERFLDLIFGRPDLSPLADEHAMYLAYAASLRSADLSRQVGATITKGEGDIVSVGANDVARSGGGLYWPGADDRRDHAIGSDSNTKHKLAITRDIFERTQPDRKADPAAYEAFLRALDGSLLLDITEYGRPVHAEMEAVLSCVRNGISTRGARLYCTTFPCHNCAKHLVDAGIREVQYVEAYPKSMATKLYSDAIFWEEEAKPGEHHNGRVVFKHYVGVGPRRYMDLFALTLSSGRRVKRKNKSGEISAWYPSRAEPRVPSDLGSIDLERQAIVELRTAMEKQP